MTEQLLAPQRPRRFERYEQIPRHEHDWYNRLLLHSLMSSIRTREKALFKSHCRDLAEQRRTQGFTAEEVCHELSLFNEVCLKTLATEPGPLTLAELDDYITAAIQFGIDEVEDVFEQGGGQR